MIRITPIKMTDKGYRYKIDKKVKIGSIVKLFGQTFLINQKKNEVYIGISDYAGAGKTNKTGSNSSGEHNLILISPNEVWKSPIGERGEINV